jgi:hypothetical protein
VALSSFLIVLARFPSIFPDLSSQTFPTVLGGSAKAFLYLS